MIDKRIRYLRYAALLTLALAAMAGAMGRKEQVPNVTTGVRGKVEIWEGNFMPMVDPKSTRNKILPGAGRMVRVYEPVLAEGGMATAKRDSISAILVSEVKCDKAGHFAIELSPGKYSMFVAEGGGWYANGFDSEGVQGAVTVESGKVTDTTIKITTKATF